MNLLLLCWEFFKIGLFAVGGGLATLPFLSDLAARHPEWLTQEVLANIVAVGESTPGPIGINMATYVGYQAGGILGSLCATCSIVLPSIVIILVISRFLQSYKESALVSGTFTWLRPTVTGLIAAAGWSMFRMALTNASIPMYTLGDLMDATSIPALILFVLMAVAMRLPKLNKLHPILWIAVGAAAGVIFSM